MAKSDVIFLPFSCRMNATAFVLLNQSKSDGRFDFWLHIRFELVHCESLTAVNGRFLLLLKCLLFSALCMVLCELLSLVPWLERPLVMPSSIELKGRFLLLLECPLVLASWTLELAHSEFLSSLALCLERLFVVIFLSGANGHFVLLLE